MIRFVHSSVSVKSVSFVVVIFSTYASDPRMLYNLLNRRPSYFLCVFFGAS
jgi:hypothetical protein